MRQQSLLRLGLACTVVVGCNGDRLNVPNNNNPDVARAYSTPDGIEGVIAGLGVQLNNPQRFSDAIGSQARILAGENHATVANNGYNLRALLPRVPIDNQLGNAVASGNLSNFNSFQRTARQAVTGIQALDRLVEGGGSLGSPAQNARAKAFAFLILGQALGYTAFGYDSAAVITPTVPSDSVPGLSDRLEVAAAGIAMLDSAVAIASSAAATNGSNGFPLPASWLNGSQYDRDEFVRLVRSFRARIRAGVALTPADRAALDWNAIIADAENGIQEDHEIEVGGSSGWTANYDTGQMYVAGGWHSMPMYYFGMADTSGGYDTWLSQTNPNARRAFLVRTPDGRWPSGATRAAQLAQATGDLIPGPGQYFINRDPGDDVLGASWGESYYDHRRYGETRTNGTTGPYTDMSKTEIDMLAAEGHIRAGRFDQAAALINISRTRNGLPAISGITSATQPIGTMPGCVPRVPQAPSFTSTACGTILEAMKYEKRMETAYTGYLIWYTDNRGWGDMIATTPVLWPVPFQEMQARLQTFFNGDKVAPVGTYGF